LKNAVKKILKKVQISSKKELSEIVFFDVMPYIWNLFWKTDCKMYGRINDLQLMFLKSKFGA
jgi:hypothetical protein